MPVYRYTCRCGNQGDQFLSADKASVILNCPRCDRGVTARQVRDNAATFGHKDGVTGVLTPNDGADPYLGRQKKALHG